jgi:hypothetical protein
MVDNRLPATQKKLTKYAWLLRQETASKSNPPKEGIQLVLSRQLIWQTNPADKSGSVYQVKTKRESHERTD